MKFTLSWLKDHLETDASIKDIALALTDCGLEVEEVVNRAEMYAPFKVVEVIAARQHPNADRLQICTIKTENGEAEVVCGAPNARKGIKAAYAPEGAYIPGHDFVLKKSVIRGVESNGMLLSEEELSLPSTIDGIIEIDLATPIGAPVAAIYGLDDPVIDIAVTPNRPDCAGVRGIARDLAAKGLGTLKKLPVSTFKVNGASDTKVALQFSKDAENACPIFVGRTIRNVKNGPSPAWMQNRLKAVGLHPISALVDITNYISLDLCRPLHVFDADKLQGDIQVRMARQGETLDALNGKTYELADGQIAICDDSGVLGLGGIVGGNSTGCQNDTTNVFLEVAYFDPNRVARTGRDLQINSDARYRFERGIDPTNLPEMADRATALILELCGGEPAELVIAGKAPEATAPMQYNPALAKRLLGLDIPADTQRSILTALGFDVSGNGDSWTVAVPGWRPDIMGAADFVEEVARIYGYDKLPTVSVPKPAGTILPPAETPTLRKRRTARIALASRGLSECVTWSFTSSDRAKAFGQSDAAQKDLTLSNPIASDLAVMRPSILPNLLEAALRNADHSVDDAKLFEIGPTFLGQQPDQQPWTAAALRYGKTSGRHWAADAKARPVDAYDAKADALAVLEACGVPTARLAVDATAPSYYHPGRSGTLRLGPTVIAVFGELHPALLSDMKADGVAVACEIYLEALPEARKKNDAIPLLAIPELQPVSRDFAFLVTDTVRSDTLLTAVRAADKQLIVDADVFDVYQGEHVPRGHKSVAVSVTLQPVAATLTDADIEGVSKKIVDSVTAKTGATLRG
jgi:phenylalanyl-tRNA synthetase beta chain